MTLRVSEKRSRLLLLACLCVFAISTFLLLVSAAQLLIGWRDSTTPEGSIAYSIAAVTGPAEVYRDYREPPYATTAYGPGYYATTGVLARVFGGGIRGAYLAGRSLSLACLVGILVVVYWTASQSTGHLCGLVCALSLCTVTFLDGWIVTARPDVVAAFLSLVGICLISLSAHRSILLASLMFAAALLVKQSFVAGPIAAAFWLVVHSEKKRALILCVCTGFFTLCGYFLAWLVWGETLIQNVVNANQAPLSLCLPIVLQFWAFKCGYLPFLLSALGIASYWGRKKGQPVEVLYLLASLFLAGAASAKAGAYINYFLEPVFAATLVSARGWRHILCWTGSREYGRSIACVMIVGALIQPAIFLRVHSTVSCEATPSSPNSRLLAWVDEYDSPLIGPADLALQVYEEPLILDPFNASYLSDRGEMEFESLVRMLESGEITAIITKLPIDTAYYNVYLWPKPIRDVVEVSFELEPKQKFGYFVYAKRSERNG